MSVERDRREKLLLLFRIIIPVESLDVRRASLTDKRLNYPSLSQSTVELDGIASTDCQSYIFDRVSRALDFRLTSYL